MQQDWMLSNFGGIVVVKIKSQMGWDWVQFGMVRNFSIPIKSYHLADFQRSGHVILLHANFVMYRNVHQYVLASLRRLFLQ